MTISTTEAAPATAPARAYSHVVKFYESEDALVSLVGDFLARGVSDGEPLVIIARQSRHSAFMTALRARGVDFDHVLTSGRLTLLDAKATLSGFMIGSLPDSELFMDHVGDLVSRTIERHGSVRAYGEMVDVLWQDGNPEAAIRLEEMWNLLQQKHRFSLFCGYAMGNFYKESDRRMFDAICESHTHVIPAEGAGGTADDPSRMIAHLQQRALALETEIRQRRTLEGALRDSLNAHRESEEELRRLYEMAQQAHRAKDQFLASLSHELRTPLTAILGWSGMLRLGGLDAETTRIAVETIERSARTQANIVDDLLDLSKIVTGKFTLQRELVDLASVIDEAVQTCRLAAEAKNIDVSVSTEPHRSFVMGDPTRLRQIVWNLFSNAVKYSDEGAHIAIHLERSPREARITVTDNGRGIDPGFIGHIFEPFRQADSSSTRGYGGLGLGLTIVKHLTELHGGGVAAQSEGAGCGSTFTVTLPLLTTEAAEDSAPVFEEVTDLTGWPHDVN
jgi:signal transduction histidine kinase